MKSMKRNEGETSGNLEMGGVKWYRKKIVEMVDQIESEKFLNQIRTLLKKHIEKEGG